MSWLTDLGNTLTQPSAGERIETWMKLMLISQFALVAVTGISALVGRK